MVPDRVTLIDACGATFFAGSPREARDRILARVTQGEDGGYVCQTNVHVLVTSWHEPDVQAALDDAWMVCPDGAPIAWMLRGCGAVNAERIAGADLMTSVFETGQDEGIRHFLFGSTTDVLRRIERALAARFPRAMIVGTHSPGTVSGRERGPEEALNVIISARPHIVWCALGAPKQELWMHKNAPELSPAVLVGVGAAFDFHAGTKSRAPEWMQRAGLEWAHRLAAEPKRLAGRYLRTNSEFIIRAGFEVLITRRVPQAPTGRPR